jgi:hypothetical protein
VLAVFILLTASKVEIFGVLGSGIWICLRFLIASVRSAEEEEAEAYHHHPSGHGDAHQQTYPFVSLLHTTSSRRRRRWW